MPVLEQRHPSSPRQTTNELDALLHMALGEATSAACRRRSLQSQERAATLSAPGGSAG